MKNIIHILIVVVCFLILEQTIDAQSFYGQAIKRPVEYTFPVGTIFMIRSDGNIENNFWVVYSDREGNLTYVDSISKIVNKTVNFMSEFYVVDESKYRLHIVKDIDFIHDYSFSNKAVDYGWVNKENMLLNNHCLQSGGVEKKCFLIHQTDSIERSSLVMFYLDPDMLRGTLDGANNFELLYIYKINKDALLVGHKPSTNEYKQLSLLGWIAKTDVVRWNNRMAIEPNWDSLAVIERRQNNLKATLCIDKVHAERFSDGKYLNNNSIVWNNDPYERRWEMDRMRFPIIKNKYNDDFVSVVAYQPSEIFKPNASGTIAIAPILVEGINNPLFRKVMYLTKNEVDDLKLIDRSFQSTFQSQNQRQNLTMFLIDILGHRLGKKINRKDLENYTFSDLTSLFPFLPDPDYIKNYKLIDLYNSSILNDEIINLYLIKLNKVMAEIVIVANYIDSKIAEQYDPIDFFWIPWDLIE